MNSVAARFVAAHGTGHSAPAAPPAAVRPVLLLVDDEERILRSLAMLFRMNYDVRSTTDAREALEIIGREPVHVIVSDQKMPLMRGADLLREVRQRSPNTMRLLLTGYSELDAVVDSVNEGEIFRFISKPWIAEELRAAVAQAARLALASFEAAKPAAVAQAASPTGPGTPQPLGETGRFTAPVAGERILVLDDDGATASTLQEIAGPQLVVIRAHSLDEAFDLLQKDEVAVIVAELEVGGERTGGALKALKAAHPEVVAMILTSFQDIGQLIGLINEGQIYRLLPKPIRKGPLAMSLTSALKHHRLLKATPTLAERHAVEPIRATEEQTVATRVMGYLSRLRERLAAASGS